MTTAPPVAPPSPTTPVEHPAPRGVLSWASLVGRLVLAGVLGYAALTKIGDPAATVRAVRAYQLLPESLAVPFGHALPSIELAVAVLLLLGVAVRLSASIAAVLMGMFVIGVASAAARGLKIDCGCFGGGGPTEDPKYALELLRDGFLFAVAVGVAVLGRSRLAMDPHPPAPVDDTPDEGLSGAERRRHRVAVARQVAVQEKVARRLRLHRGIAGAAVAMAAVIGVAAAASATPGGVMRQPSGVTASGGVLVGSATAPHRLVVFEDPQCPVCGQFEQISGPVLAQAVAQGKVSVEYRLRSFLGPESVRAVAALGAAADEGGFEKLREVIFTHQPQEHAGGYTVADLLDLGASAGLTGDAFTSAVKAQTFAAWARAIDEQASRDGNVGTPELRLDGRTLEGAVVFDPARLALALGLA